MPIRTSFAIRLASLVVVIVSLLVANTSPVGAEPPASPAEMLEDAELTDVHFADPDRGWAVGDRGVIWRTEPLARGITRVVRQEPAPGQPLARGAAVTVHLDSASQR